MDLSKYQIPKQQTITNERQLIIKDFLDRLNSEIKPPYKPITPARLGMMLSPCTVSQLKQFYGDCNYAKNFAKYFWWRFKK
jgi:hypothetical protein